MKKLLFLILFPLTVFAQDPNTLTHNTQSCVDDFANVLSEQEENLLNAKLKPFFDTVQISVVTVNTLNGMEPADYGLQLFKHWKIGNAKANNGVLITICPSEHQTYINTGYGVEGDITDGIAGEISRSANDDFRESHFYSGIDKMVTQVIEQLSPSAKAYRKQKEEAEAAIAKEKLSNFLEGSGYFLLVTLILSLIGVLLFKRHKKILEIKENIKKIKWEIDRAIREIDSIKKHYIGYSKKGFVLKDIEELFPEYWLQYQIKNNATESDYMFVLSKLSGIIREANVELDKATQISKMDLFLVNMQASPGYLESQFKIFDLNIAIFNYNEIRHTLEKSSKRYKEYQELYKNLKTTWETDKSFAVLQFTKLVSLYQELIDNLRTLQTFYNDDGNKINASKNGKINIASELEIIVEYHNANKHKVSFDVVTLAEQNIQTIKNRLKEFNNEIIHDYNLYIELKNALYYCKLVQQDIEATEAAEKRKKQEEEDEERRKRNRSSYSSSSYSSYDSSSSYNSSYDSGSSSSSSFSFGGGDSGGGGGGSSW